MLLVQGKSLGARQPLFEEFSVPPPTTGEMTLLALIRHVVTHEVQRFQSRQAGRRLVHSLTARQIEDGLARGKVDSGGSELNQEVDLESAVGTAVEAFRDGLYLIVLDDSELKDLDARISLTDSSRLTFIRLSLLAGG